MNQKPEPYAYVLLAVGILALIILLPVIWSVLKGIVRIVLTLALFGFAIYGIYVFINQKKS
jgi:E3 ubiquitin-protein ligase DOA10